MDPRKLSELTVHQQRLLAIIARCEMLVDAPGAIDVPAMGQLRWELMRMLRAYQLHKHVFVFDPAIAAGPPATAMLARAMKRRCEEAGAAYTAYVVEWSSTDIALRDADYRSATRLLMSRSRAHLGREMEEARRLA